MPQGGIGQAVVKVSGFSGISGFQGSLHFDTSSLQFAGFGTYAALNPLFDSQNFNSANANAGWMTYLWSDPQLSGQAIPDSSLLFSLFFRAKGTVGTIAKIAFSDTPTTRFASDTSLGLRQTRFDSISGRYRIDLKTLWLKMSIGSIYLDDV